MILCPHGSAPGLCPKCYRRPAHPPEPTPEQCNQKAQLPDFNGWRAFACWYPQMGGHGSRAVVLVSDGDGCFEAYVWHDGSFPFHEDDDGDRPPAHIHHCMAEQFIEFGEWIRGLIPNTEDDTNTNPTQE